MTAPFVRPDVRAFLDYLNNLAGPRGHEIGPEGARQMMVASRHALDAPLGELATIRDFEGAGADGNIRMRLFDSRSDRAPGPLFVSIHGGGFVLGDLDTHEPLCGAIARGLDMPVVAIDYRLAPEHPFPAGVEDSITAARWLASGPEELGFEPTGLVLGGDSAGGNFALVVSAALRDEPAAVPVLAQWGIYPAADPANRYPSYDEYCEGHLLTREGMRWFDECYTGAADDWRFSPMLKGMAGLPPTLITTASLDPIRDQGRVYAAKCVEAGVETIYWEAQGTIHGFLNLRKAVPSANADLDHCFTLLRGLLEVQQ